MSRASRGESGFAAAALTASGVCGCAEGCAGGCSGTGPNVSVEIFPLSPPGEREDHVAVDWKTYVYSLGSLDCLATVIEENLGRLPVRASRRA